MAETVPRLKVNVIQVTVKQRSEADQEEEEKILNQILRREGENVHSSRLVLSMYPEKKYKFHRSCCSSNLLVGAGRHQ